MGPNNVSAAVPGKKSESLPDPATGDRLARRNALILAVAQALAGGNSAVIVSTGAIVGAILAPDRALATVPITTFVVGMWAGALPVGALARRFGRRLAFQAGAACGVVTGLAGALGILGGSFELFLAATFVGGLYAAAHTAYRFAATDTASDAFRPKAISWVLAGGLFAAFLGPQLVIFTKDLWPPYLFAASYLAQAAVALLAALVLARLHFPSVAPAKLVGARRALREVGLQPRFVVAVICGTAGYGLMNLVMTSAPLAMVDCGHSVTQATLGLQWHVVSMYGPSFITGTMIARWGAGRIVTMGFVLLIGSAGVGLAGTEVANFWLALILLGLGWNFAFVGATTMITQCHRPEDRNSVQALNDFLVFGSVAVASFSSGKLLASFGWSAVMAVVIPVALAVLATLGWLAVAKSRQPA